MPQASSLAARIRQELGTDPELVRGDNGIFDVIVDGSGINSKHETGQFPTDDEICDQLSGL